MDSKVSMLLSNVDNLEKYVNKFCEETNIEMDEDLIDLAEEIQLEAEQMLQDSLENDIKEAEEENKRALQEFLKGSQKQPQLVLNVQPVKGELSKIQEQDEDEVESVKSESEKSNSTQSNESMNEDNNESQKEIQISQNDFNNILTSLKGEQQSLNISTPKNNVEPQENVIQQDCKSHNSFLEEKEFNKQRSLKEERPESSFCSRRTYRSKSTKFMMSPKAGSLWERLMTNSKTGEKKEFEGNLKNLLSPQNSKSIFSSTLDQEIVEVEKAKTPKDKSIHEILQEKFDQFQKEKEEKKKLKQKTEIKTEKQEVSSIESDSDEEDDIIEEVELQKMMQNRRKAIFGELTSVKV